MNPYPLRIEIMGILAQHRNKWLKARAVAKEAGLDTPDGINHVSNILYRLRHTPHIERKRNSPAYLYRYYEEIKVRPTTILPSPKTTPDKKAAGNSDDFNGFSFIESLDDATEGFCELCGVNKKLSYKAEKNNQWVFACKECGEKIKGQSEVFEWECFA